MSVKEERMVDDQSESNQRVTTHLEPNKRKRDNFSVERSSMGTQQAGCEFCKSMKSCSYSRPDSPASGSGDFGDSNPPELQPLVTFDADHARLEVARMIIDYPLLLVDHQRFLSFIQTLQPQFEVLSFDSVSEECVKTYRMWKEKLQRSVDNIPSRVCLTLDIRASSKSGGYIFITGHFINADWKLQRRLLNVVMEPYPNSDHALSHALAFCVNDWNLKDKIFSITINQNLGKAGIEALRSHVKNSNILLRCMAGKVCAIASDILEECKQMVAKVRDIVKYVKTSNSNEKKFIRMKQLLKISSDRSLTIDDANQWNTTYEMLVAASELKEVFSHLEIFDPDCKGTLSSDEWKQIETICSYLQLLFHAAKVLTTTTAERKSTPITLFYAIWNIQSKLYMRVVTNEGPFSDLLSKRMLTKFDPYWKSCCLALATAVVMDPRYKMEVVEVCLKEIYGNKASVFNKIVEGIRELFHEYEALPPKSCDVKYKGTLLGDHKFLEETTRQDMRSELDQYLDEPRLPHSLNFDLLMWWKVNKKSFPKLSKMAADILAITTCSVSSDSVFRTGVEGMDSCWNSFTPEMIQTLKCAKDWKH